MHLFQAKCKGDPISSNSKFKVLSKFKSSKNFLSLFFPICFAIFIVPIFEDLIRISLRVKLLGSSSCSVIVYFEHLISFGISLITVLGENNLFSKANVIVNVLNIDPNSKTPFVILFIKFLSLIS